MSQPGIRAIRGRFGGVGPLVGACWLVLVGACSSSDENAGAGGAPQGTGGAIQGTGGAVSGTGGAVSGSGGRASGGSPGTGGRAPTGGSTSSGGGPGAGGSTASGGSPGTGGIGGAGGTTSVRRCTAELPAGARLADVSSPTAVIGTGTPESCTGSALKTAVAKGGVITFDCGPGPATIPIASTLTLPTDKNTVLDGGGTVTLDGQGAIQIFSFHHPDWMKNETRVTLQRLTVTGGKTTPLEAIPERPAPCSQGFNDGEGGALFMRNGNLTVIDCTFAGNRAAPRGPDTGGGAIYITGSKHGALIVNSTFTDNAGANAGAVGALFATLQIYDSVFRDNRATGDGANNNDPSKCDYINNDQNEVGSGGNGGAIYQDGGNATNVFLCGVDVQNNAAGQGAFGGGVFMTSNDYSGTITVQDSIITGNTGGSWTQVNSGPSLGSAFGVNAKSSTIINSTLQGVR